MKVLSEFTVKNWNQSDLPGERNTLPVMRVSAVFISESVVNGIFLVEYVMHYQRRVDDNTETGQAQYAGILCFDGEIDKKSGTFALEDNGTYKDGVPSSRLRIIEYSGTGDFTGIIGTGEYYAENGKMILKLDYSFRQ